METGPVMSVYSSETDLQQDQSPGRQYKMTELLGQSYEVLHEVFSYLHPQDLARLSRTCSFCSHYIKHNRLLWRNVYLRHYDEPPVTNHLQEGQEIDWEQDAQDFVSLTRFCQSTVLMEVKMKPSNMEFVARTIIKLAESATIDTEPTKDDGDATAINSRNRALLESSLAARDCLEPFVHGSNLYHAANGRPESNSRELSQLLAKVHCLHGIRDDKYCDHRSMMERITRQRRSIPYQPDSYARSRVYDLRLYNEQNQWGPWSSDGLMSVDWEMLECIMLDLGYNAAMFTAKICRVLQDLWRTPFKGVQPYSYVDRCPPDKIDDQQAQSSSSAAANASAIPRSSEPLTPEEAAAALNAQDPFGVSGMWQRVVCFLDYSDFHYVNFHRTPPLSERRPPIVHEEAIRLIMMELKVTRIEPREDSELPRVHFKGISRSMHTEFDHNARSQVTGFVELTPEKEVRWSTLSWIQGEARWRSEGVQIGGIKSDRGVCGTWFDKDQDPNGPCGPSAFWKITDSISDLRKRHGMHVFDAYGDGMSEESDDGEFEPGSEQSDDEDVEEDDDDSDMDIDQHEHEHEHEHEGDAAMAAAASIMADDDDDAVISAVSARVETTEEMDAADAADFRQQIRSLFADEGLLMQLLGEHVELATAVGDDVDDDVHGYGGGGGGDDHEDDGQQTANEDGGSGVA